MTFASLAMKNVLRQRGRTILTIIGIAVAVVLFTLMRTVIGAWTGASDAAAKDRLVTRHKVTFINQLPKKYVDEIKQVPGVKTVSFANWFGAKDPAHPEVFFGNIAIDPGTLLDVYPEIEVDPAQLAAWKADRRGAIVGDQLASKMGWKIGQTVTLKGSIFPGDWEFLIDAIYTTHSKAMDRSSLWFQWDYLNESPRVKKKDQVGWIVSRIDDPSRSATISRQIDQLFDDHDNQTSTMDEKSFQQGFLGFFSAVITAINIVSLAILAILLLVLGNTIAMNVRERTAEYGCLRAIGFMPRHIAGFVTGEAMFIGLLGGLLGLAIAVAFINLALGPMLEENGGGMFPTFRVTPVIAVTSLGAAMVMAAISAIIPARRAARLDVVTALRSVE